MAGPEILPRRRHRVLRRGPLVWILVIAMAAAAGAALLRARATPKPSAVSHMAPNPLVAAPAANPPEVWQVESTDTSETYSNGLWIDTRYAVANHERAYLAFPANGSEAVRRTEPAGIVFHTTESSQAAFRADDNGTLRRIGESLLDYVRRKRAYHFVIDRFGRVHRVVQETDAANHAGFSVWADSGWFYIDLNESFFGVAFEARTGPQGGAAISEAQARAAAMLVEMLRSRYKIAAANCVTHAQVSVNPSNMRAGYHTDWAFGFPFAQVGLPDNYLLGLPSVGAFGFAYDGAPNAPDAGVYAAAERMEARLREHAAEAALGLAAYRAKLQESFRKRFEEVRRFRPPDEEGSS